MVEMLPLLIKLVSPFRTFLVRFGVSLMINTSAPGGDLWLHVYGGNAKIVTK